MGRRNSSKKPPPPQQKQSMSTGPASAWERPLSSQQPALSSSSASTSSSASAATSRSRGRKSSSSSPAAAVNSEWVPIQPERRRRSAHGNTTPPALDLHGFTKEQAIRRLVEFLEVHQRTSSSNSTIRSSTRTGYIVHVITGVGRHSSTTSMAAGPVLRPAVASFLQRHDFEHYDRMGCFAVDAMSGSLHHHQRACLTTTKLVVTPSTLDDTTSSAFSSALPSKWSSFNLASPAPPFVPISTQQQRKDKYDATSSVVARAQASSLQDHERHQRQVAHEQRQEMQRALALSLRQYKDDVENESEHDDVDEDRRQLDEAIRQSADWSQAEQQAEEAMIEQVLALSRAAAEAMAEYDDSTQGEEEEETDNRDYDDDEYEQMMQQALEESAALEASEREEEEAWIQQAILAVSVQEQQQDLFMPNTIVSDESKELSSWPQPPLPVPMTADMTAAGGGDHMEATAVTPALSESCISTPLEATESTTRNDEDVDSGYSGVTSRTTVDQHTDDALLQHVLSLSENVTWEATHVNGESIPSNNESCVREEATGISVQLVHYVDDTMVLVHNGDDDHVKDHKCPPIVRSKNDVGNQDECPNTGSKHQDQRLLLRLLSQGSDG